MEIMRIAGFSAAAAVAALTLRRLKPEMGAAAAMAAGVMVLIMVVPYIGQVVSGVTSLAEEGGVKGEYMTQLLKVAGVSLLMDFAAQTCRDAGEEGLAMKSELAGRVMILTLALPTMRTLLRQILALAP